MEALETEVLTAYREKLGNDHPCSLLAASNLAITFKSIGRYAEAAAMQRDVLEAYRRHYGDEGQRTLDVTNHLATTLRAQGDYDEAARLQRIVLEARERLLGTLHPDYLTTASNLAHTYSSMGKYDEAIELDKRVLASRKRVLGERHPSTLSSAGATPTYLARTDCPVDFGGRMNSLPQAHADNTLPQEISRPNTAGLGTTSALWSSSVRCLRRGLTSLGRSTLTLW